MNRTLPIGRLGVFALAAVVVAACGSPPGPQGGGSSPRPVGAATTRVLPRVVLRADLSEPPAHWTRLMTIPYGDAADRLGFLPVGPAAGGVPVGPPSFAVAGDGSIWIVDPVKGRLAHFSPSGQFLGAMDGLGVGGDAPAPSDMVASPGEMYVLMKDGLDSFIATARDGAWASVPATRGGRRLEVVNLVSGPSDPVGWIGGFAAAPGGTGPSGYARLSPPPSGTARPLPGVPVGPGAWISLGAAPPPSGDQDFAIEFDKGGLSVDQPIRVTLVDRSGEHDVPAVVGPAIEVGLDQAVGAFVQVSPSRPGQAAERGGAWYLRVGDDGSAVVWERLPFDASPRSSRFDIWRPVPMDPST